MSPRQAVTSYLERIERVDPQVHCYLHVASERALQAAERAEQNSFASPTRTMKHAGAGALSRISPLLDALRARPVLRERRPGVFELKSRAFLHFHEDPSGIFADVRLDNEFVRLEVTSVAQQSELLARIDDCLWAVESRVVDRQRRGRRAKGLS